jgi:LuxR family maltose regulon positive regulatory protein
LVAPQDFYPQFIYKLLAAFDVRVAKTKPYSQTGGQLSPRDLLVEPLTDRECEVLKLIAAGYTNQQIANTLVVTLNTVKKHTTHIYGKLRVQNRTEASNRARELGMI